MKVWDLGTYPSGLGSWVGDINDFGVAVGWASLSGWDQQHPAMIPLFGPKAMQWVDLGTLGGEGAAEAFGISDTGIIVGHSFTSAGNDHAFVWTSRTSIVDLGTLPGHTDSQALDINRVGTLIVGWSGTPSDQYPVAWTPSVRWTSNGWVTTWQIHQLDASPLGESGTGGSATAVNNLGQIVGTAWIVNVGYVYATVVWNPVRGGGGWKAMQLFGSADCPTVLPAEINDLGEVVGGSYKADWSPCRAALWQPKRASNTYKFTQLANPWGLSNRGDWGVGINNRGDIAGVVIDENGSAIGAQWTTKDLTFVNLVPPLPDQTWSYLANLNEFGIASGGYGGIGFMHGLAVQLY